jgi:uncharacterized LabA/DUF88 family protein
VEIIYSQNLTLFASLFLKPYQSLEAVRYFSAIQHDVNKASNQDKFFQANKRDEKFNLVLGIFKRRHKWKRIECTGCNKKDNYKTEYWEEKKSDVALASYLIRDVSLNKCDAVFLFCADSDLTPALDVLKELNSNIKIITFFPPGLSSFDLLNKSTTVIDLSRHEDKFRKSLMPEHIKLPGGYIISCPTKWQTPDFKKYAPTSY